VALTVPGTGGWGAVLKSVKEQLRAVPHKGLSHQALRYLRPGALPPGALPDPQVSFNYHGQWSGPSPAAGLYRGWHAGIGPDSAADSARTYLLDVTGVVQDGELQLGWTYSAAVHDEATVRQLAEDLLEALREIVEHCAQPGAGGATPSDFPLAALDQRQVDRIVGDGRSVDDIVPLAPLQAGMLFHSLVDAGSTAYLDQFHLRLSGVADPAALGAAWQRVVDRTPALRSALVWDGVDAPLQVVHRHAVVPSPTTTGGSCPTTPTRWSGCASRTGPPGST
jgi:non-ribosomal peptide synthase protein (TIGR01720 family)